MLTSSLLLQADSLRLGLPDRSVHTICTSSPYWSLRDYKLFPTAWPAVPDFRPLPELDPAPFPGCDPGCDHEWGALQRKHLRGKVGDQTTIGHRPYGEGRLSKASVGRWCQKCGGWLGCLGQEPTPAMFTAHLVALSREFWRVLRDDGTYWLNLGDSYAGKGGQQVRQTNTGAGPACDRRSASSVAGLKQKDIVGIPWRVAFALQADGWYLRICNVWAKGRDGEVGNDGYGCSMPMSRTDAPVISHESVLLLTKKPRYYYDAEAVRVHWIDWSEKNPDRREKSHNLRSVWIIPPEPYAGAHFAVFPTGLPELCLKASVSERGVCSGCGAPWKRVVERTKYEPPIVSEGVRNVDESRGDKTRKLSGSDYNRSVRILNEDWVPSCACYGKPERGPVTCPRCKGSGKKRAYPRGNQEWNAGTVAIGGQPQRDTKGGVTNCPAVEIDEPCPKCKGEGTVIGDVWPDGTPTRGPVPCAKCKETGRELIWSQNLKRAEFTAQTGRTDGHFTADGTTLRGRHPQETGRPCPACSGTGTVTGELWPADMDDWPVSPSIVLDPFCGSARTGAACRRIPGPASFIGADLSGPYLREHAAATLATRSVEMGDDVKGRRGKGPQGDLSGLPLFSLEERE